MLAHRLSYAIHVGSVATDEHVLHTCDVRACVNPKHLYRGTHDDNMSDKVARNRVPRGEMHHAAKYTNAIILALKNDLDSGKTCAEVANQYGMTRHYVNRIARGEIWPSVRGSRTVEELRCGGDLVAHRHGDDDDGHRHDPA